MRLIGTLKACATAGMSRSGVGAMMVSPTRSSNSERRLRCLCHAAASHGCSGWFQSGDIATTSSLSFPLPPPAGGIPLLLLLQPPSHCSLTPRSPTIVFLTCLVLHSATQCCAFPSFGHPPYVGRRVKYTALPPDYLQRLHEQMYGPSPAPAVTAAGADAAATAAQ